MNRRNKTFQLCFIGILAAMIMVINYLTPIPFLGTKLRFSNALCALAGLLLGPWIGALAAGIGSALYDLVAGYGIESLITFVSKGAIALIAGFIAYSTAQTRKPSLDGRDTLRLLIGSALGAFANVALYMLKTYLFGLYVKNFTLDATLVDMGLKLPGSLINAVFATLVAPALFTALHKPLRAIGMLPSASLNDA